LGSVLDMTLDDVIKIKGKRGGGRGPKKSVSGNQATVRKPVVEAKKVDTSKEDTKAAAEKPTEKVGETKGGGRGGVRRLRRVTAAQALAPAAKAAAAAAKATATAATVAVTGASEVAAWAARTPSTASAAKVSARSVSAPTPAGAKGTEEKLGMSLEDLLKFEVKKRKPKPEKTQKSVGGSNEGSGVKRGARRKVMKLRATPRGKARAKAKGKAKAKAKAQFRSRGRYQDDGGWRNSGREFSNTSSWGGQDGWRRPNSGGGMYADWNTGSKRKAADDWGPFPEKRFRSMNDTPRNSFGWGRSNDDSFGWGSSNRGNSWGGGSGALSLSGSGAYRPGSDRWGNSDSWGGSSSSDRGTGGAGGWTRTLARTWGGSGSDWGSAAKSSARRVSNDFSNTTRNSSSGSCRIRVSNVPKNLDWRDIKEAFEDNGRVTRCEVERGVAWVTFESSLDAKKAVQTFDRGELNGQTIFVTHE